MLLIRDFVMVTEDIHRQFHERWREIDSEWRGGLTVADVQDSQGIFDAVALGIESARDELRAWARHVAPYSSGGFLIPV